MIRLVGLSATLPNYIDVAQFLHVNLHRGLFYFDDRFRPVPLQMSFMGVRGASRRAQEQNMNEACYERVLDQVKNGEQVSYFVGLQDCILILTFIDPVPQRSSPSSWLNV